MVTPTAAPDLRADIARLRQHNKSNAGAPAYSRFVNRPLGRVLAALAHRVGATPDAVTAASAVSSLLGIVVVAAADPSPVAALVATTLLVLGYALDSADGQLARLRGGGSPAGEWLDHVVDCAKISLLHVAVLIGLERAGTDRRLLVVPLVFLVGAVLYFFVYVLTDLVRRLAHARSGTAAERTGGSTSILRSLLVAPTDYGVLCLAFLLWWAPSAFLAVYGLLALGTCAYVLAGLPKWRRDVQRLPSG